MTTDVPDTGSDSEETRLAAALDDAASRRSRGETLDLDALARAHGVARTDLADLVAGLDAASAHLRDEGEVLPRDFGEFRLVRELGRGGMGIVYEAIQRSVDRPVAVKIMASNYFPDAGALARFRREASAASRLEHPNICTVYDAGRVDGTPYIVMQRVEGRTLAQEIAAARERRRENRSTDLDTCSRHRSSWARVTRIADIVEQTARAVHAAHEAGIVHRDVKPGNVMLTPEGRPVLLDFGLARFVDGDQSALTQAGDAPGTLAYMAPESLDGQVPSRTSGPDV